MSDNYQKLERSIAELDERLRRVENKSRGYINQKLAAEYIGRSVEFLRSHHANGTGPARMPSGQYALQDLDEWMRREIPAVPKKAKAA